jgi:hypothetical protein
MRRALLASLIVGTVAPLVGTWIVLRRLAYLGDAMSHATVGGVAVAYLGGWSLTAGAIGAGLVMAALMGVLARRGVRGARPNSPRLGHRFGHESFDRVGADDGVPLLARNHAVVREQANATPGSTPDTAR